ncbi:MAG TPA: Rrf2 family transcriptional regulator [Chitinophagaceae bacterium]|nr:Rrf2 family transcriptional regulator [Chitinophagaceae bacterium]
MVCSKSFGYALRGVLYVALMSDQKKRVQVEEIAEKLSVPKHYLGKIMKLVVKEGILSSTKGPYGGFSVNQVTLETPLINLYNITDGLSQFNNCVLNLRKCNASHPCPLHNQIEINRKEWIQIFAKTKVSDLLKKDDASFIKALATI